MTKEMRPSHRVDILTDALLHYARKSSRNLSKLFFRSNIILIILFSEKLLPLRFKRAESAKVEADKKLIDLRTTSL